MVLTCLSLCILCRLKLQQDERAAVTDATKAGADSGSLAMTASRMTAHNSALESPTAAFRRLEVRP